MSTAIELKRIVQKAPKPKGWKPGADHSFSKLYLVMPDGSRDIRWSLDWKGPFSSLRNQELGIKRLQCYIVRPERRNHEVAIIYDAATNEKLYIYRQGQLQMSAV